MTLAEQAYHDHLLQRPEMPRPFNQNHAECIAWQRAYQWWVSRKEDLEATLVAERAGITYTIIEPTAGKIAQKPKDLHAKRKASPCATKEYMAQKARESRERKKARMESTRQAVREVIKERDAA